MNMKTNNKYSKFKRRAAALVVACIMTMTALLTGCTGEGNHTLESGPPEIQGLTYESTMELKKADQFSVYFYEGGYALIDIHDYQQILVVPEKGKIPKNLSEDITVLQKPVNRIYLAATATMAMFCSLDALDSVRMSSVEADDWTFDEPREAMESGKILYAGRYNSPDFETMLDEECDLAIESTMIDHVPEIKETLLEIGIPVLVDRSSYETDPMGRAEWIKLYGVITGHEDEADKFFNEQMESIKGLDEFKNTGKTVAFFYFSTTGHVVVRRSTDYVPRMIEIAGGKYVFKDLDGDDGRSSTDLSVETFYDTAKDADIIVYNSSIDASVRTMADLLEKNPIMKKMKAVQEGNCWVTGKSMYQRTDLVADMILDFHRLITSEDTANMKYIMRLE